jgi:hypothetical protein
MHQVIAVHESQDMHIDSALEHAAAFERTVREASDPELRAMAYWPSLAPLLSRGDLSEARARSAAQLEWTRENVAWGVRDWGFSAHVGALFSLGSLERFDGSLVRARELLERGVEVARGTGDFEFEGMCFGTLASLACSAGEPERGRVFAHRHVKLAERSAASFRAHAHIGLSEVLALAGETEAAIDALEHGEALSSWTNELQLLPGKLVRAQAWLAAGEITRARAEAEQVFTRSLELGARLHAVEAALILSAAIRTQGDPSDSPQVESVLGTAERLIAETGARNFSPLVLLERAASLLSEADAPARRALLARALAEFTRMGATGRLRQVELMLGAHAVLARA